MKLTIEQLETLASDIQAVEHSKAEKLQRLIVSYCKIITARYPGQFTRKPLEYSDVDGHFDNSYPPDQTYKEYRGPRLIEIIDNDRKSKATSKGFYHGMAFFTTDPGLFVSPKGEFYGCSETGTGRFGMFAARPGTCDVLIECEWIRIDMEDVPLDRLIKAEKELRDIAFPLTGATHELQLS